jgi:hypothetical protein
MAVIGEGAVIIRPTRQEDEVKLCFPSSRPLRLSGALQLVGLHSHPSIFHHAGPVTPSQQATRPCLMPKPVPGVPGHATPHSPSPASSPSSSFWPLLPLIDPLSRLAERYLSFPPQHLIALSGPPPFASAVVPDSAPPQRLFLHAHDTRQTWALVRTVLGTTLRGIPRRVSHFSAFLVPLRIILPNSNCLARFQVRVPQSSLASALKHMFP